MHLGWMRTLARAGGDREPSLRSVNWSLTKVLTNQSGQKRSAAAPHGQPPRSTREWTTEGRPLTRKRSLVRTQYRPPSQRVIQDFPTWLLADCACRTACLSPARIGLEQLVHNGGGVLHDRSKLVPVDQLGDRRSAVAHQLGDLLQRHPGVREHRHERVSQ